MPKIITQEILEILAESYTASELINELRPLLTQSGGNALAVLETNYGRLSVRGDADISIPYLVTVNEQQDRLIQAITAAHEIVHLLQYAKGEITTYSDGTQRTLAELPAKIVEAIVYHELRDREREAEPTLGEMQKQLLELTRDDAFDAALKQDEFLLQQFKNYYPLHTKSELRYSDGAVRNMIRNGDLWAQTSVWLAKVKQACPIE